MRPGLAPGVNVDKLDIGAGLREAAAMGFDDETSQMVAQYALQRWARGEEEGAIKTARIDGGIDLTSFYRMVAAAAAACLPKPPAMDVYEVTLSHENAVTTLVEVPKGTEVTKALLTELVMEQVDAGEAHFESVTGDTEWRKVED